MLQLPQTSARRSGFSRKEIAEIARGGKPIRDRSRQKTKPDPVIALIEKVEIAHRDYIAKKKAVSRIRDAHDSRLFARPVVELPQYDMIRIDTANPRFFSAADIDDWAKRHLTHCRDQLSMHPNWRHGRNTVRRVKELRPLLKKELAQRIKGRELRLREIGFTKADKSFADAHYRYFSLLEKLYEVGPTTPAGAIAMLKFVRKGFILMKHPDDAAKKLSPTSIALICKSIESSMRAWAKL